MSGEDAIRMYLQFLADPAKLVDAARVEELEAAVDRAADPIDKLRAIAALERARAVDGSGYEEDFIRDARAWAEQEGIPSSAFRAMGVPDEVLVRAGLDDGRRRGRGTRRTVARPGRKGGSTTVEAVQEWVLARTETFTLADVQRDLGGSPATIKKAIDELIGSGRLVNLGPLAEHIGRGRAPYHYRLEG